MELDLSDVVQGEEFMDCPSSYKMALISGQA